MNKHKRRCIDLFFFSPFLRFSVRSENIRIPRSHTTKWLMTPCAVGAQKMHSMAKIGLLRPQHKNQLPRNSNSTIFRSILRSLEMTMWKELKNSESSEHTKWSAPLHPARNIRLIQCWFFIRIYFVIYHNTWTVIEKKNTINYVTCMCWFYEFLIFVFVYFAFSQIDRLLFGLKL